MSSCRTSLRALVLLLFLPLALACQGNDDPTAGPSGPVVAAKGGCDNDVINAAADFLPPNSDLFKLCGDAEKEAGDTDAAGVLVGRAFALIDDNFPSWGASNEQVVDLVFAFCSLAGGAYCPTELTAGTLTNFEASCTEDPSSTLVTDNGRFAVFVLWDHAQHQETCAFVLQAPHDPAYAGDCTGFLGNSRKDCQDEPPGQTGFHPAGAAVIFPNTVAGSNPDASIIELCSVLTGEIDVFAETETSGGPQPTVPFDDPNGVPGVLLCAQPTSVPGGLPGLVWNVTRPLRSLLDATPVFAGGGSPRYAFSGTVYAGTSPNDRQCSCSGRVTGKFDAGSEGVIVEMTLDTSGYPETGTIVGTTVTDDNGDYTVGGVCPDELENDYTLEFAKTEGNQSHRATVSDICVDLSAEFPTKEGLDVTLVPGANN